MAVAKSRQEPDDHHRTEQRAGVPGSASTTGTGICPGIYPTSSISRRTWRVKSRAEGSSHSSSPVTSWTETTRTLDDLEYLAFPRLPALADYVDRDHGTAFEAPAVALEALLGLTDASATLSDSYLLIDTSSGPGMGLVNETIQFHGQADLYTTAGATALATLYSSASVSASECTAIGAMPSSRQARMTRIAISPRFAISTFSNIRVPRRSSAAQSIEMMRRQPRVIRGS